MTGALARRILWLSSDLKPIQGIASFEFLIDIVSKQFGVAQYKVNLGYIHMCPCEKTVNNLILFEQRQSPCFRCQLGYVFPLEIIFG